MIAIIGYGILTWKAFALYWYVKREAGLHKEENWLDFIVMLPLKIAIWVLKRIAGKQ